MLNFKDRIFSKPSYLNESLVKKFVDYLTSLIDGHEIHHEMIIRDRKLPFGDLRATNQIYSIKSLEEAFNGYWWDKDGYQGNYEKLKRVEGLIRDSIYQENDPRASRAALAALCQVLEWGAGGTGQRLYTANKAWAVARLDTLIESLRMGRTEMTSDSPDLNVFKPSPTAVYARMNAGFTKYYALACDGVLIYDGRVGAALGVLVRNFCKNQGIHAVPEQLAFRWGAQSGSNPLNRNPSNNSYIFQKLPTEGPEWALWNIRANWIVNAARDRSGASWVSHADGLRRIEAALFVIGYSMPENDD